MQEKMTPDKISKFLLLIEKEITLIEKDIDIIGRLGSGRESNINLSRNILEKELEKLKNDLEVFRHTDISNITSTVFEEKFMKLLEELK